MRPFSSFLVLACAYLPAFALAQIAPVVTKQPRKASLTEGERLELHVEVSGNPTPTLKWYLNGNVLEDYTGPDLIIPSVVVADSGRYYVEATNSAGATFSEHARVTVRENFYDRSVARQWNEETLGAIRLDYPAPTVHSRNLFTVATAMYDAWCAYDFDGTSVPYLVDENPPEPADAQAAREEAISHAAFTILRSRYRLSPGAAISQPRFRRRMEQLGYDPDNRSMVGDSPAAVGNRIGAKVLALTWTDGSNEIRNYADQTGYQTVNPPLVFKLPGAEMDEVNQWQPLAFDYLVLQNGIVVGAALQKFLGPNWGGVRPFALVRDDPNDVYQDPGPPPYLSTPDAPSETDQAFKDSAVEVIKFSSWLDPEASTVIDVSPGARHNNPLGTNDGEGYPENPFTQQPYEPNEVLLADYARILAEFWADGPDSETPPGHWNSVANHVSDHELFERRFEGQDEQLDELEWDVKLYFALDAAVSDAAIACWDAKRKYNYARPISMIRLMGGNGQSSDPDGPSYHPQGLPLVENLVEVVTEESSAPGQRHDHLAANIGEIAIFAWRGVPDNPATQTGGVDWILATTWMPFQRDTFVTPPFAAYTSGHSTFSRAAAEVLTLMTGSKYFPGGISTFTAMKDAFLEFEVGPTEDVTLTWASYYDAADEAGISRLYGGIHVRADDFGGRKMGSDIGKAAYAKAKTYFEGSAQTRNTLLSYAEWAAPLAQAYPNNADATDFFGNSPYTNLERFAYGLSPLDEGDALPPYRQISLETVKRLTALELDVFLGADATIALEFSSDLEHWTRLSITDAIATMIDLGEGRARIGLHDSNNFPAEPMRYVRVVYALPE